MFAQSPGGVSGVELWAYPQPETYDLDSIYSFKDVAGDNAKLQLTPLNNMEFRQHRNVMQSFNFHPSLHFNGTDSAQLRINGSNASQATIIGVLAPDDTKNLNDSIFYRLAGRREGAIVDSITVLDKLKETQEYRLVKISKPILKWMLLKIKKVVVKELNMNSKFTLHME